jgi:hypothetical protein
LLVALLASGRLGLQQGLGPLQPGQPLGPAGQCPRQLAPARGTVLAVLGPASLGGLGQELGDLGLEVDVVRLAAAAAASTLVPSRATSPRRTRPAAARAARLPETETWSTRCGLSKRGYTPTLDGAPRGWPTIP